VNAMYPSIFVDTALLRAPKRGPWRRMVCEWIGHRFRWTANGKVERCTTCGLTRWGVS
jgi:hypothetical protein